MNPGTTDQRQVNAMTPTMCPSLTAPTGITRGRFLIAMLVLITAFWTVTTQAQTPGRRNAVLRAGAAIPRLIARRFGSQRAKRQETCSGRMVTDGSFTVDGKPAPYCQEYDTLYIH